MGEIRFDCFLKKIHIKAPLDRIYASWVTTEGLTAWFLSSATFTKPDGTKRAVDELVEQGDRYDWKWHNWDERETGKILEANGHDFIKFSFGETSNVAVRLTDHGDSVLVALLQDEIPIDETNTYHVFYGCSNGWTFWLTNLKAYLEHGILLNETSVDLRDDPFAGFEYVNI